MSSPPFWGNVGKSALFQVPQNGRNNGHHLLTHTFTPNGGQDICFVRLPLLGGFLDNLGKTKMLDCFGAVFPAPRPKNEMDGIFLCIDKKKIGSPRSTHLLAPLVKS